MRIYIKKLLQPHYKMIKAISTLLMTIIPFGIFTEIAACTPFLFQERYQLIIEDTTGGPEEPQILVVNDPATLKAFYRQVNKTRKPGLAIPKIDFTNEFVVILCMGTRKSLGYSTHITHTEIKGELLTVYVKETIPGDTSAYVLTEPFSVYKINGTYESVVFKKEP